MQTGITGVTDIEVTSGLQEGDQIVTGSYKALRTLRPGASVKVDNSPPKARRDFQLVEPRLRKSKERDADMAVERSCARTNFRQDLVDAGIVIQTEDLWKTYEMGAEKLHALRGVTSKFARANTSPSWGRPAPANPR